MGDRRHVNKDTKVVNHGRSKKEVGKVYYYSFTNVIISYSGY